MDRTPYSSAAGGSNLKAKRGVSSTSTRVSTPYERPSSGRHASSVPRQAAALAKPENASWLGTGIVDSASRILTKGATFLFTSLFKRQAPAITENEHWARRESVSEEMPPLELVPPSSLEDASGVLHHVQERGETIDGDARLENILRESNLTREQCERYISLIKSKFSNRENADAPGESRLVIYGDRNLDEGEGPSSVAPSSDAHVRFPELPYEAPRAPWERNERPSEPQIQRPGGSFGSRWTPFQMPITGGRELLKRRITVLDEGNELAGPARRAKDNHLGPGFKNVEGDFDLSCFRKDPKALPGSRLMSVPKQSTRNARKILDTLDKRTPFKDRARATSSPPTSARFSKGTPPPATVKAKDSDLRNSKASGYGASRRENLNPDNSISEEGLTTNRGSTGEASVRHRKGSGKVKSVRFSIPSTDSPSEQPPAPQPTIPSPSSTPVAKTKPRDGYLENGQPPFYSESAALSSHNVPSSSTANGTAGFDMPDLAARAEKVSFLLNSSFADTRTPTSDADASPPTANGFYPGASSGVNAFAAAAAAPKSSSAEDPCPSGNCGEQKQEPSFGAPNPFSFSVGAQSLAPPETSSNPFAPPATMVTVKNSGFALGSVGKISKKKKSSKRIK